MQMQYEIIFKTTKDKNRNLQRALSLCTKGYKNLLGLCGEQKPCSKTPEFSSCHQNIKAKLQL